jgi:hypothetical protein
LFVLLGETVLVKVNSTNKIRVFPIDQYTLSPIRNNQLYDLIMKYMDDMGIDYNDKQNDNLKGHRGKCVLRDLSYFDVGISFVSDSLHNCYHGVTVSKTYFDEFYLFIALLEKTFLSSS